MNVPFFYEATIPISYGAIPQYTSEDITITISPYPDPTITIYDHAAIITKERALFSLDGSYTITVNITGENVAELPLTIVVEGIELHTLHLLVKQSVFMQFFLSLIRSICKDIPSSGCG